MSNLSLYFITGAYIAGVASEAFEGDGFLTFFLFSVVSFLFWPVILLIAIAKKTGLDFWRIYSLAILVAIAMWCAADIPAFLHHKDLCARFPYPQRLVFPGGALVCAWEGK